MIERMTMGAIGICEAASARLHLPPMVIESSVDGCPSEVQVSTAIKTALNAEATAMGNFTNVQRQALSPALPLALQAKHSIRAAFGRPIARSEVINVVKLRDPDNLWSSSQRTAMVAPPAGSTKIRTNRIF